MVKQTRRKKNVKNKNLPSEVQKTSADKTPERKSNFKKEILIFVCAVLVFVILIEFVYLIAASRFDYSASENIGCPISTPTKKNTADAHLTAPTMLAIPDAKTGQMVQQALLSTNLTAPSLTNNPTLDAIITNTRPLLSFMNSSGGLGARTYEMQIDKNIDFNSSDLISYSGIAEINQYKTEKLVEENDALDDDSAYYWRARAVDSAGQNSPWTVSRFYVDTASDDHFMDLVRTPVKNITVSTGQDPKNIMDLNDPGQSTFWLSAPPGNPTQWINFELDGDQTVSRIWMLSDPSSQDGWLSKFYWQYSLDGEKWNNIPAAAASHNDTFRNILNFKSIKAKFLRLIIEEWIGYAPQINSIIIYSPGQPPIPSTPSEDYVLVIGNQQDGYTFTQLADYIESLPYNLKTVTVPHYEVSLEMINKLPKKPVAVILSGNNADYGQLPMFEFNGDFEIIRESGLPILGICAGHQFLAMAYGYTNANSMGWSDITSLEIDEGKKIEPINILVNDPIFKGMPNPFTAAEVHSWSVARLPDDFELLASSSYIQAIKSKSKLIYGEQFHGEINVDYNQGGKYIDNFLQMAINESK